VDYRLTFSPQAQRDYDDMLFWIADRAGLRTSQRFMGRLQAYCESFRTFPHRGTLRDDVRLGLRWIGFERRVTILFDVVEDRVTILRLLYGGRDVEILVRESD
jgi:toxin ParE1/3/4